MPKESFKKCFFCSGRKQPCAGKISFSFWP